MKLSTFASREIKFGEALFINHAADVLSAKAPAIAANLPADINALAAGGTAAVIAAVEKADSVLGPIGRITVNGALSTYSSEIQAELSVMLSSAEQVVEAFLPKVVAAMQAVAAKLNAEALAA